MFTASATIGGDGLPSFTSGDKEEKLKSKLRSIRFGDKERETKARAAKLGLPYFNLDGFPINPESVSLLTEKEARALGLVCFWYSIKDLRFGSINPESPEVQKKIKELSIVHHTNPRVYLISLESLRLALESYKRVPKPYKGIEGVTITEAELSRYGEKINSLQDLKQIGTVSTTEAVIIMIAGGLKTRASDIHIEAEETSVSLRYRIDGVLYPVAKIPQSMYKKIISRLKLLSSLKINVTDKPQDGRFTIHLSNDKIDVRVSTLPTAYGESIVMRLLQWSEKGVDFEQLGLTGKARERLVNEMSKPNGMILSTGPTGSGKTTTLYSIITKLARSDTKIITLEDPIEYRLPGVNQSQVDKEKDYTFAVGLRSLLRQDPNIVMVGEIRDLETADIAANAALTGHLVLSTLHTNSAAGAIPRLLNIGLKRFLLPPAINTIIGQRLVRRICESCKKEISAEPNLLKRVKEALNTLPAEEKKQWALRFYKGDGCEDCQGLGYKGQVGLFEVLVINKEIEQAILETEVSESKIEELARADGMITMLQDGVLKALQGVTTLEEVFRVTKE